MTRHLATIPRLQLRLPGIQAHVSYGRWIPMSWAGQHRAQQDAAQEWLREYMPLAQLLNAASLTIIFDGTPYAGWVRK